MADACATCGRLLLWLGTEPPEDGVMCDCETVDTDRRCPTCRRDYARRIYDRDDLCFGGCAESALAAMRERAERAERQRGEARMLLIRMVKYCREDKATTARATRLERLVEQVADYLNRTHDPADIPRCEDGKAGGA